jgi:hypothetical protein
MDRHGGLATSQHLSSTQFQFYSTDPSEGRPQLGERSSIKMIVGRTNWAEAQTTNTSRAKQSSVCAQYLKQQRWRYRIHVPHRLEKHQPRPELVKVGREG